MKYIKYNCYAFCTSMQETRVCSVFLKKHNFKITETLYLGIDLRVIFNKI